MSHVILPPFALGGGFVVRESVLESLFTEVGASVRDLLVRAYDAGVSDGREQMREAILSAAKAPINLEATLRSSSSAYAELGSVTGPKRAAHGSVRDAVSNALTSNPDGLTTHQVEAKALALDNSISPRSVGGELRRMRGLLYRSERGLWFLIAKSGETETTENVATPSVVPLTSTTKEETRAPDTTIAA